MEYLRHVVVRRMGKVYQATCLRCGLRLAAAKEPVLQQILQAHLCQAAPGKSGAPGTAATPKPPR